MNLNEYLKSTREKLSSKNYATLTIAIGNVSCDLDSAVSALVYAAFLHWQHNKMQCRVCTRNKRPDDAKDDIFVPILNVERADYEIKTEVAHCLNRHGVHKQNLVFINDFALQSLLTPKDHVVLVDHHVLPVTAQFLAPMVTEIIDHRPMDKSQWLFEADTRVTIEMVGSCATLVTRRIRDLSALFAKERDFFEGSVAACEMLLSAIILDTVNFSKEAAKGTLDDDETATFLETFLEADEFGEERGSKLARLLTARKDVSTLSAAQLLRKDAKTVAGKQSSIFVPSLPILIKEYLSRPDAMSALESVTGRGTTLLLGMDASGTLRRDGAVYCPDETRKDQLSAYLQAWIPSLDLSPDKSRDRSVNRSIEYFTQGNLSASRKQYMPALTEFLTLTSTLND